ncbi:putative expression-site associated protein [Leptomonas pyrrhocoris]|uniref:Putative expression-site associated protein n=1 Tax=Leptomonas pyrrhocoris TaxID=157538 RepID=A0A0M9FV27_LEPPY|nr:putative expression-site associated protein [Leptomonas pyrrhocoris]KPA76603.1 putative expression-site associated protein [Leptomonas pyrrhocoris]|eukprot:XP_015655042.1 putative expression-site associated protein [Leptomonas pyrrhocoris]
MFTLCLSSLLYLWLAVYDFPGVLDGHTLTVPYRSHAYAYAAHALYIAPLPSGTSEVQLDGRNDPELVAKVQRRSNRQQALEDEVNGYLRSVGIERDRPVRVRFHILSNYVDWKLCTAVGAAALGGFSIPVTGFNASYSHIHRFNTYLDFVKQEGLRDEDIVVTLDSDVFWTGADFVPFLKKFARFSPATEAELDVAAVRAWEDYGEKKAPLFMERLQKQGAPHHPKRPSMQLPPVVYNADDQCWWGQHSEGFVRCPAAFAAMEHLIEAARNGKSSYTRASLGSYTLQCATDVRRELGIAFAGGRQWMKDSIFNVPNANSPYAMQRAVSPSDPLFYRVSTVNRANPINLLNGGMHVSRVWALRHLASTIATYVEKEKPVPEAEDHHTDQWWCDQALFGQIYTRARLFEIEHGLLDGPPLSERSPPVVVDPRFGPPGFLGVDRRSEMVVLAPAMERNPALFHDGGYLERQFPESAGFWVRNRTRFLLGDNWPKKEDMDYLQMTRGGALVTPPLLWRSATPEDRVRGYANEQEDDADTVHVPFIHYAAPTKQPRFSAHRNHFAWLVAARHDRRARAAARNVLSNEVVELWMNNQRVFVEYLHMCDDPMLLASRKA